MRESTDIDWGLSSRASWHVPTCLAIWGAPILMIGVRVLIWFGPVITPATDLSIQTLVIVFSVMFAIAHIWMMLRAALAE